MKRFTLSLTLTLLCVGCAAPETRPTPPTVTSAAAKPSLALPTQEQARDLINTSGEFSQFEFTNAAYTLPMRRAAMNPEAQRAAADLRAAGWIAFDGDGNVELTAKAKEDKRWLVRQNGVVDLVPLARKDVGAVTGVNRLPDGKVAADFDWHWITNEVGSAFRSGPVHDRFASHDLRATATLAPDGTAWSVLGVTAR